MSSSFCNKPPSSPGNRHLYLHLDALSLLACDRQLSPFLLPFFFGAKEFQSSMEPSRKCPVVPHRTMPALSHLEGEASRATRLSPTD